MNLGKNPMGLWIKNIRDQGSVYLKIKGRTSVDQFKKNDFVVVQDAMTKKWTNMVKYQPGDPKWLTGSGKKANPRLVLV